MEYCPACKSEIQPNTDSCAICNHAFDTNIKSEWIKIGSIQDNISAGYAKETLESSKIPVVIISNSGMFGAAGLSLNPFHGEAQGLFDVSVPEEYAKEATEVLNMILGDSWTKKD